MRCRLSSMCVASKIWTVSEHNGVFDVDGAEVCRLLTMIEFTGAVTDGFLKMLESAGGMVIGMSLGHSVLFKLRRRVTENFTISNSVRSWQNPVHGWFNPIWV